MKCKFNYWYIGLLSCCLLSCSKKEESYPKPIFTDITNLTVECNRDKNFTKPYIVENYEFDKYGVVAKRKRTVYIGDKGYGTSFIKSGEYANKKQMQFEAINDQSITTSVINTLQFGNRELTETYYWTYGQDQKFIRIYTKYKNIDGKKYIASMFEKRYTGSTNDTFEETYRIDFDYSNFKKGELSVVKKLYNEVVGTDTYNIEFYEDKQFPDIFLIENLYPLSCHNEFLFTGIMGTFDYYIVACNSELENAQYTMDYEFNANGLPMKMTLSKKHNKFSNLDDTLHYQFKYN